MALEIDIQKSNRNWRATVSSKLGDIASSITSIMAALPSAILTTRGDIITRSATVPQRLGLGGQGALLHSDGTDAGWLALGSSGNVLTSNGTDAVWQAPATGPVASAVCTISGTTLTIAKSSGITSVTRTATGVYNAVMSSTLADTNYRVHIDVVFDTTNTGFYAFEDSRLGARTTTKFFFTILNNGLSANADAGKFGFTVFA